MVRNTGKRLLVTGVLACALAATLASTEAAELRVGAASVSITPDKPVALRGHHHIRIARKVRSPVTATVLALEARENGQKVGSAIMVSCDLCVIPDVLTEAVREQVRARVEEVNPRKVFLCATHTHTAPQMVEGVYDVPEEGVMQPADYVEFAAKRIGRATNEAWESRGAGGISWGLGHAVVAHSRRPVYADGSSRMHGPTDRPGFRRLEGSTDHGVETLFFWDDREDLIAAAVLVPCPAQAQTGSKNRLFADFWHPVRQQLRERYGEDVEVLGLCGASGEHTPLVQFRDRAERRMRKARGLTRTGEMARRIVDAVADTCEVAREDIRTDVTFAHTVQSIELARRRISEQEYETAKEKLEALQAQKPPPGNLVNQRYRIKNRVLEAYRKQDDAYEMELHVLRLGRVAVCTNDFELFTDYGIQIQARSPALQTFVVQLAGPGLYVPTQRAVRHGGYSTGVEETVLGPKGGRMLVDKTVEQIKSIW